MPKIFGMNIRSLLFMPGHLDLQTDPISGIPKACPHSRNTSRRGSSKNDERSRRGPKGSFSSARTSSRIGSMLRRLSSSTKGSREDHDAQAARRHVARRVQEMQLTELIVSMGVVDHPHAHSNTHLSECYPQHYHHQTNYSQPLSPIINSDSDHDNGEILYRDSTDDYEYGVPYSSRIRPSSTVRKRPALRDIDFYGS